MDPLKTDSDGPQPPVWSYDGGGLKPPVVQVRPAQQAPRQRRVMMPVLLFLATCWSTYLAQNSAIYFVGLMTILTAHELGHFFQTLRYRVPASLPYFLPMPLTPIGTMGAVIAMQPGMGNRRALFDIAVTGPLAGLIPALVFSFVGLQWSEVAPVAQAQGALRLGEPLLFQWMAQWIHGTIPEGHDIYLHPLAFAGWVGILITALNMIPIGQLDGGHILYALLLRNSRPIATLLLAVAAIAVVVGGYTGWILMIMLLLFFGASHPPTADDTVPLGAGRTALGWITLVLPFVGFTPTPFVIGG